MTSKQRLHAALDGRPLDRLPVVVLYYPLYQQDHFAALSGRPEWELHQWLNAPPEEHTRTYLEMAAQTPFDMLEPQSALPREARARAEFLLQGGRPFRRDRGTGRLTPLSPTVSGHARDYHANEEQIVFDHADVKAQVLVEKADRMIARGDNDYLDALIAAAGATHFILSGGVIGTLYSCTRYLGMTNLFELLAAQPDLVDYLSSRILESNIEHIRRLAAAEGDAIFIDDATATSDMISVAHYERFSLPYMTEMVREIHRLGHKAIIIYFGGVGDRLDQIASIGADALSMETSMKGYVNDIADIAARIGDRVALFGNIDPVGILERGGDGDLEADIARQVAASRRARGFIISTGSPITPGTPLSRVRRFIELARKHGAEGIPDG